MNSSHGFFEVGILISLRGSKSIIEYWKMRQLLQRGDWLYNFLQHSVAMSSEKKQNKKVVEEVEEEDDDDEEEAPATFADLYAGKFVDEGG